MNLEAIAAHLAGALRELSRRRNDAVLHPDVAKALRAFMPRVGRSCRGDVPQEAARRFLRRVANCRPEQVATPEGLLAVASEIGREVAARIYSVSVRERPSTEAVEIEIERQSSKRLGDDEGAGAAASADAAAEMLGRMSPAMREAILAPIDGSGDRAIAARYEIDAAAVRMLRARGKRQLQGGME